MKRTRQSLWSTHNLEIVKSMNKRVVTMRKGVVVDDTASDMDYHTSGGYEPEDDDDDDFFTDDYLGSHGGEESDED